MQRKSPLVHTLAALVSLLVLNGCNNQQQKAADNNQQQEEPADSSQKNPGTLPFDAALASKYIIPIDQAMRYQKGFISTKNELRRLIKDTGYLINNFNLPNAETFPKDALLLLLNQRDAYGVRFYYGKDSKGAVRLILLPVRKDGTVIYKKLLVDGKVLSDSSADGQDKAGPPSQAAEAVETGQTCPPCLIDFNN